MSRTRSSDDSKAFLHRLEMAFYGAANERTAEEMRAYMRDQFFYLGLPSPTRRALFKEAAGDYQAGTEVFELALRLFEYPYREYQYVACDLLRAFMRKKRRPDFSREQAFGVVEHLIRAKQWWDTIDILVPSVAYPLICESEALDLRETAHRWIEEDDF